jgi:hypothetical protein
VNVRGAEDAWWREAPPELEGRTRLSAAAESAASMWDRGLTMEHAAQLSLGLLLCEDPDALAQDAAYWTAVDAVKDAARAMRPGGAA